MNMNVTVKVSSKKAGMGKSTFIAYYLHQILNYSEFAGDIAISKGQKHVMDRIYRRKGIKIALAKIMLRISTNILIPKEIRKNKSNSIDIIEVD